LSALSWHLIENYFATHYANLRELTGIFYNEVTTEVLSLHKKYDLNLQMKKHCQIKDKYEDAPL
jgi:hypothetical protein